MQVNVYFRNICLKCIQRHFVLKNFEVQIGKKREEGGQWCVAKGEVGECGVRSWKSTARAVWVGR